MFSLILRAKRTAPRSAGQPWGPFWSLMKMIRDDVLAQLKRTDAAIAAIPTLVDDAVRNAEANKDSDHADDVAALTSRNDALEQELADLRAKYVPSASANSTGGGAGAYTLGGGADTTGAGAAPDATITGE